MRRIPQRAARAALTAAGFTIVEMVTTMVILSVLAAVCSPILANAFRNYIQYTEVQTEEADARLALERMMRELRRIRSPADITTMTCSPICTLTFTDITGNSITYTTSSGNLTRKGSSAGTAQILASSVTGFTLTFLEDDGQTAAPSAANVYYIAVQLTIATSGSSIPKASASYVATVRLESA